MGSKRKIAKPIIDYIIQNNPNAKYFYDLFGGGGAITIEAIKRKQFKKIYYNELNTGVVELLKHIINKGITPEFYDWVDRDSFNTNKNNNDYWGGFLKTCWSFGNNQKDYLYSKDIEELKIILGRERYEEDEKNVLLEISCGRNLKKKFIIMFMTYQKR
jgi:site-specific DNA-adenine methylase